MRKKYEVPELDIHHINLTDRLTSDVEVNISQMIDDPEYGWEEW